MPPSPPENHDAELAAVMAVIAQETDCFLQADFDGWAACWVQDARTRTACMSSVTGATLLEGWEALSSSMRSVIESGNVCKVTRFERSNISARLSGELAHVVFDATSQNINGRIERTHETRLLERSSGIWRILYSSFVLRGHQGIDGGRIAVNARGEIVGSLEDARRILAEHPSLGVSNTRLRAARPEWDKILQAGLECAAAQHGYFEHYGYMTASGRRFRLPLVLGETEDGGVAVCILFVRDGLTFVEPQAGADLVDRLGTARLVYGLSEAQMQLAQRIVSGDSLKDASNALGISVNTARTHLSRIYAKTGVNAQTALVRTLLSVG